MNREQRYERPTAQNVLASPTVKYEHIYLRAYEDGLGLHQGLTEYFRFYNWERKHQSLGYQTPAQWYENRWEREEKIQFLPTNDSSLN